MTKAGRRALCDCRVDRAYQSLIPGPSAWVDMASGYVRGSGSGFGEDK